MTFITKRQNVGEDSDFTFEDEQYPWWWSKDGQIVRWSVFFSLFFGFMAYMVFGYIHAKKRINKGLPPLKYHRWLLSRRDRARSDPNYQSPAVYYNNYPPQNPQYGMHPMPPPVYNADLPPAYQPPAGATKIDPSQWRSEPTRRPAETTTTNEPSPAYEAPPGPPPAAIQANHTGASTVSNNPYRL